VPIIEKYLNKTYGNEEKNETYKVSKIERYREDDIEYYFEIEQYIDGILNPQYSNWDEIILAKKNEYRGRINVNTIVRTEVKHEEGYKIGLILEIEEIVRGYKKNLKEEYLPEIKIVYKDGNICTRESKKSWKYYIYI
jgi:hypothetical protein